MPKCKFNKGDQCESPASCPLLGCAFPLIGTYKRSAKLDALIFRALKGSILGNGSASKVERLLRLVAKKAYEAGRYDGASPMPNHKNFNEYFKETYGKRTN